MHIIYAYYICIYIYIYIFLSLSLSLSIYIYIYIIYIYHIIYHTDLAMDRGVISYLLLYSNALSSSNATVMMHVIIMCLQVLSYST